MERGFTLVEMLVVIGIFSLISGSIIGIFLVGVSTQRKILAKSELLNEINFALEYMEKALRMAKKDDIKIWDKEIDCSGSPNDKINYKIIFGGEGVRFRSYDPETRSFYCREFYLEGEVLKEKKEKAQTETFSLTSQRIKITNFKINLLGQNQEDSFQPRVTILIEAETREKVPSKIKIQTTISQRDLDLQY